MKTKTFRTGLSPQQALILPFSVNEWLREDHPVRALAELVDQLDLRPILSTYRELRGQPPYDPRMMVKVFVYAYSVGIRSSRRIERALYDDIAFRWLSGNQQPDHAVIAEFRRRHHEALGNILLATVQLGKRAGMLGGHDVAYDGSKFKANASKHAAMSYGFMEEEEKRLRAAIDRGMAELEANDRADDHDRDPDASDWTLEDDLKFKEKRLERIKKAKAELEARARAKAEVEEAERKALAEVQGKPFEPKDLSEVKPAAKDQYNFTDPESRILFNSEKTYIQGYNGQAAVDAESMMVVAADVTTQSNDYGALEPMVAQTCENLGEAPTGVLADAGYFSAENLAMLEKRELEALIPPNRIPHAEWREQPVAEGGPPEDADLREAMRHKLRTRDARRRYKKRQQTVEPTFGHLKEVQGQRQELLRWLSKVRSMWRFQCAVYNLMKLVRAGVSADGPMRGRRTPMMAEVMG